MPLQDLLQCVANGWSPVIGDPTVMGWVTVLAYLIAAVLCGMAAQRDTGRARWLWIVFAVMMAALAVNKELDLQSALTAAGRCLARAQGWYDDRRAVQAAFIAGVAIAGVVLTATLIWLMRRDWQRLWPALLGCGLLLSFVAIRAAGFHRVDRLIGMEWGAMRLNWLFELSGIALIGLNAAVHLLRQRRN